MVNTESKEILDRNKLENNRIDNDREEVKRAVATISEETKDLNNNEKSPEPFLPMDIGEILKPVNDDQNEINNKQSEQSESVIVYHSVRTRIP